MRCVGANVTFGCGCAACRWWVCSTIEPVVAETMLLNRLDYALNYLHNNDRRGLIF